MRTGRSLTVCWRLLPGVCVCVCVCVCSRGGCLLPGGVSALGGLLQGGVCSGGSAPRGISQHALRQTLPPPPPVDRILDTRFWKYYLGPTSLRPVIKGKQIANRNRISLLWWCFPQRQAVNVSRIEFSHNTQSWQHWHLIQMHQKHSRKEKEVIFSQNPYKNIH